MFRISNYITNIFTGIDFTILHILQDYTLKAHNDTDKSIANSIYKYYINNSRYVHCYRTSGVPKIGSNTTLNDISIVFSFNKPIHLIISDIISKRTDIPVDTNVFTDKYDYSKYVCTSSSAKLTDRNTYYSKGNKHMQAVMINCNIAHYIGIINEIDNNTSTIVNFFNSIKGNELIKNNFNFIDLPISIEVTLGGINSHYKRKPSITATIKSLYLLYNPSFIACKDTRHKDKNFDIRGYDDFMYMNVRELLPPISNDDYLKQLTKKHRGAGVMYFNTLMYIRNRALLSNAVDIPIIYSDRYPDLLHNPSFLNNPEHYILYDFKQAYSRTMDIVYKLADKRINISIAPYIDHITRNKMNGTLSRNTFFSNNDQGPYINGLYTGADRIKVRSAFEYNSKVMNEVMNWYTNKYL